MSTTLPPAPPLPPEVDPATDPEALIEEARRRARRRRALYALAAFLAAGAAIVGFAGFHGGDRGSRSNAGGSDSGSSALPPTAPRPIRGPANGPLALVEGEGVNADRIVLVGQRGRLMKELPICRPPRCGAVQSASWSPDGRTLAYGTVRGGGEESAPRDGLHLLDLKTSRDYLLSPGSVLSNWQGLAWSPDGTKLAYVEGGSAYVMQVAKPERITLIRPNATSPTWSPDGRRIAFDRCVGQASGIDLAHWDGSHVRQLTRVGCSPAWSHDGTRIAYTVSCGIKLMSPTGKQLTPPGAWRCQHVGVAGPPAWSPDSRRIAIAGRDGVYVMNRNGSGLSRIWDQPAQPSWRPIPRS